MLGRAPQAWEGERELRDFPGDLLPSQAPSGFTFSARRRLGRCARVVVNAPRSTVSQSESTVGLRNLFNVQTIHRNHEWRVDTVHVDYREMIFERPAVAKVNDSTGDRQFRAGLSCHRDRVGRYDVANRERGDCSTLNRSFHQSSSFAIALATRQTIEQSACHN